MLIDEQEVLQQNRLLEQEIKELKSALNDNKKELKYHIGLTIGENLRPRKKILGIPKKVKELLRDGVADKEDNCPEEPFAYHKYLQEQKSRLIFYNDINRSDIHYAIGEEVYNARHSISAKIRLPFRLWRIRKSNHAMDYSHGVELPPIEGIEESILFIATNGAGLGHLTRCLAVARRLKKRRPQAEIIFLTTSVALTTIHREGFTAYSLPSMMLIKNITSGQWNVMLKNMMTELLQLYNFSAVIFDGAIPFAAITAAMAKENNIPQIWIRRGSEKSGELIEQRDAAEKDFDYVIVPGEAQEPHRASDEKHIYVPPIIYLDKTEAWSGDDVRRYLKIPSEKIAVYVQLGAGNINNIDSDINKVILELRKHPDVVMVLGESMIGDELKIVEEDIIVVKDYPNSKYLNGFDFAISACGYNSFHELVYFGVPTIFIPNMNAKVDDQYARAMIAQNHDAGIVVTDIGSPELAEAIACMCDKAENGRMRANCSRIIQNNGADNAADIIINILKE